MTDPYITLKGTDYRIVDGQWVGEAPTCPYCLTDLEPRIQRNGHTGDLYIECQNACGEVFDVIRPDQQQELDLKESA